MFGVCLGYVGHYQGQSRRSQFRRLGRHSSNPGLPVNNSSELSKIIKNQLSIRISSCIVFCWFLLSWLMSHGGETLKQNCGYSCYVVQAVHTSIHLTRHWHCFELTGNSEVHHARDARLIKIDRDWSRLWSWYSTVCFASAMFSLALSGRETSTTPQKFWKARGLEGCPEIKTFPRRTHRNWFLLHIFWWIGMYIYSDYTRIFIFVLSVTPISACVCRGWIPVKLMSFSQMISNVFVSFCFQTNLPRFGINWGIVIVSQSCAHATFIYFSCQAGICPIAIHQAIHTPDPITKRELTNSVKKE